MSFPAYLCYGFGPDSPVSATLSTSGFRRPTPMTIDDPKLSGYLDRLCNQGCTAVREAIEQMEAGKSLPELAELSNSDQQRLLRELKSIMAVYDSRHYH